MTQTITIEDVSLSDLPRLAASMLQTFTTPATLALTGTLGAGKTTFVQAIAAAAGIDAVDVTSPTFTLLQTYQGSIVLHHLDAYRVADDDEFLELGVEELFEDQQAWTLVEWGDRVAEVLPAETIWIRIELVPDDHLRWFVLTTSQPEFAAAAGRLRDSFTAETS